MHVITDPRCADYQTPGHPERPARISLTVEALHKTKQFPVEWGKPAPISHAALERAHDPAFLNFLQSSTEPFDSDTANPPDIFNHACRSVGAAIRAMEIVMEGGNAFSLMRPPGHHATRNRAMGFCYLSTMAITVLEAQARGVDRIAVFDFDVHHGNGTEDILLNRDGIHFFSIHQSPCFPGTGTENRGRNCFNYPAKPFTPRDGYCDLLRLAFEDMMDRRPELIGVSAGFDAYHRDPLAQETLEAEDFHWLGSALRQCGVPFFSILEGGYSGDLPELILNYLEGANPEDAA